MIHFSKFMGINYFVIHKKYIYKHLIKKQLINNKLDLLINCCQFVFSITYDIILVRCAQVRCLIYSWWESNMVIPSKEPLVSLRAKAVRLSYNNGNIDKARYCENATRVLRHSKYIIVILSISWEVS